MAAYLKTAATLLKLRIGIAIAASALYVGTRPNA